LERRPQRGRGRRLPFALEEEVAPPGLPRYSEMSPFDRVVFRFAQTLRVITGVSFSRSRPKFKTAVDRVLEHLEAQGAVSWNKGLTSSQIASHTGYNKVTVVRALNILQARKQVVREKRGKNVRYFLAAR